MFNISVCLTNEEMDKYIKKKVVPYRTIKLFTLTLRLVKKTTPGLGPVSSVFMKPVIMYLYRPGRDRGRKGCSLLTCGHQFVIHRARCRHTPRRGGRRTTHGEGLKAISKYSRWRQSPPATVGRVCLFMSYYCIIAESFQGKARIQRDNPFYLA